MSRTSEDFYESRKDLVKELTPFDFEVTSPCSLKDKKCSFVFFYAPWCPYCKQVKEEWKKLGDTVEFKQIMSFNCEKYKEHLSKMRAQYPGIVPSFPTFIVYSEGEPKEVYKGERKLESFMKKLLEQCS